MKFKMVIFSMVSIIHLLLIPLFGLFLGCATRDAEHSTASVYAANSKDLATLKACASKGDAHCSAEVGDHYFFGAQDVRSAQIWYRLAVDQKNNDAIFRLATTLNALGEIEGAIAVLGNVRADSEYRVSANKQIGDLYSDLGENEKSIRYHCVAALLGGTYSAFRTYQLYAAIPSGDPAIEFYWANLYGKQLPSGSVAYRETAKNIEKLSSVSRKSEIIEAVNTSLNQPASFEDIDEMCIQWRKRYPFQSSREGNRSRSPKYTKFLSHWKSRSHPLQKAKYQKARNFTNTETFRKLPLTIFL